MTPLFCCGAECGVNSAGTNVGQHWDFVGTTSFSTAVFDSSGLRSIRTNPTAAKGAAQCSLSVGTVGVFRERIRIDTVPSVNSTVAGLLAGSLAGLAYNTADGKWYAGFDDGTTVTLGSSGVSIATGSFVTLDIKADVSANPRLCDVQIDGVALGQASLAVAAGSIGTVQVGGHISRASNTYDIYHDHIVVSATGGDYPIGNGKVLSFVPNADGTHTATSTHIVKGTAATPVGAAITSATTDAFNWVNARPIGGGATDATRLINQQTLLTTEYAEVDFEPTTETSAPRAVEVLTADQQASTASGGFSTKLNDNGTENVIITRSAAGVVTDRFVTKQYATMPADSAAWTLARFNALKARFGYSGDATPDQYWRGIMIEAEFAVAADSLFAQGVM